MLIVILFRKHRHVFAIQSNGHHPSHGQKACWVPYENRKGLNGSVTSLSLEELEICLLVITANRYGTQYKRFGQQNLITTQMPR